MHGRGIGFINWLQGANWYLSPYAHSSDDPDMIRSVILAEQPWDGHFRVHILVCRIPSHNDLLSSGIYQNAGSCVHRDA